MSRRKGERLVSTMDRGDTVSNAGSMVNPAQPFVPQIRTPERWTAGVYANGVGVWSTQTEVTLDFVVNLPFEQGEDPTGQAVAVAPQEVVARVKIPPPLLFQLMRNLAAAQDQYEAQWGPIPDHQGHVIGGPDNNPGGA